METQGHTLNNYETAHLHSSFGCWLHRKANMHSLCLQTAVCTRCNALSLLCLGMGTRSLYDHKHRLLALQVCVAQPWMACRHTCKTHFILPHLPSLRMPIRYVRISYSSLSHSPLTVNGPTCVLRNFACVTSSDVPRQRATAISRSRPTAPSNIKNWVHKEIVTTTHWHRPTPYYICVVPRFFIRKA